jgi:hypothetical protein
MASPPKRWVSRACRWGEEVEGAEGAESGEGGRREWGLGVFVGPFWCSGFEQINKWALRSRKAHLFCPGLGLGSLPTANSHVRSWFSNLARGVVLILKFLKRHIQILKIANRIM